MGAQVCPITVIKPEVMDWKSNHIFSGKNKSFPCDLFIELVKYETSGQEPDDVFGYTMEHLTDDLSEAIRSKGVETIDGIGYELQKMFDVDKDDLLYQACLIRSLTKGLHEDPQHFLIRIKYVINVIQNNWIKIFLLLSLNTENIQYVSSTTEVNEILKYFEQIDHSQGDDCVTVKEELSSEDSKSDLPPLDSGEKIKKKLVKKRSAKLTFDGNSDDEKKSPKYRRNLRAIKLKSLNEINLEEKTVITQIVRDPKNGNKPVYVCAICKAIIPSRRAFSLHTKELHNGMIAQCDCCDYQADNMQRMAGHRLSVHEKVTEGYGILYCDVDNCSYRCVVPSELSFHKASRHEKRLPRKICEQCGKVYESSVGLNTHKEIVHLGIRKYPCDQCDKRYVTLNLLNYHKARVHEKHKPSPFEVVCEECGKTFPRRNAMLAHIRAVHRGEKNYVCPHCGKAFFGSGQLRNHIKGVHQLDKEYVCPHCDRGLPNAYQLKVHINNHLKKKFYHCRLCDSWYTAGYTLAFHIAVRHLGFSQIEAKKKECISMARAHEAYEKVKEAEADVGSELSQIHNPLITDVQSADTVSPT